MATDRVVAAPAVLSLENKKRREAASRAKSRKLRD